MTTDSIAVVALRSNAQRCASASAAARGSRAADKILIHGRPSLLPTRRHSDARIATLGDVGDFGKHGLLRFLSGETDGETNDRFRLGVLWYLTHDQTHTRGMAINRDGDHLTYLMPHPPRETRRNTGTAIPSYGKACATWCLRDARCVHCVQEEASLATRTPCSTATPLEYQRGSNREARREDGPPTLVGLVQ